MFNYVNISLYSLQSSTNNIICETSIFKMLIRHGIQTIVELSALDYDIYAVMDKTLTSSSVDNMVLNAVGGPKVQRDVRLYQSPVALTLHILKLSISLSAQNVSIGGSSKPTIPTRQSLHAHIKQ